jgi:hypothetical protein
MAARLDTTRAGRRSASGLASNICLRTRLGRHGFFTELVVRQGVDPVTAAKAGRWSDPNLPMRIYAHAETDEADVRARFRTNHVQDDPVQTPKQQKSKKE